MISHFQFCPYSQYEFFICSIFHAIKRYGNVPFDEVSGERLIGEIPISVDGGGHFEGISSREDRRLKYSTGIDERMPRQGVDVDGVPEVRLQELVDRVECTELPVRRYRERFDHCVGVQPAFF